MYRFGAILRSLVTRFVTSPRRRANAWVSCSASGSETKRSAVSVNGGAIPQRQSKQIEKRHAFRQIWNSGSEDCRRVRKRVLAAYAGDGENRGAMHLIGGNSAEGHAFNGRPLGREFDNSVGLVQVVQGIQQLSQSWVFLFRVVLDSDVRNLLAIFFRCEPRDFLQKSIILTVPDLSEAGG
jgi:hypothetical protein